jgi:hypothetical protein
VEVTEFKIPHKTQRILISRDHPKNLPFEMVYVILMDRYILVHKQWIVGNGFKLWFNHFGVIYFRGSYSNSLNNFSW